MPAWLPELRDRVIASDPGLTRLRSATGAAVAMGSALGVEAAFARLTHVSPQGTLVAMLLGAIVAMMGAMALGGAAGPGERIRIALGFPVAVGVGLVAGIAASGRTDTMLAVFVVVMFVAVFVRRFGPPFFFYGFMTWMGYFFAAFLHATWSMVGALLAAVGLATVWVLALGLTVLRGDSTATLRRTVRAFDARARAVLRATADLLEAQAAPPRVRRRLRRRLRARQARLAEVALMVEAWSAQPRALPPGWSAPALRRRLLDEHQCVDDIVAVADAGGLRVLDRLARRDDAGALVALREVDGALAPAVTEFVELAARAEQPPGPVDVGDFAPVVTLAMGSLPGAPAAAVDVPARGIRWNPLARRALVTRQAIQVAAAGTVAIVAGRELSASRYYWAVIAAFIMFSGTATRAETFVKGVHRVAGTLVGLFASIWVANLTAGNTTLVLVVIVASMFLGFYLVTLSYAYMIFFVTIMVGQLYSVLHEFSDDLLVLRLEETAIGAAAGFAVALVVVPLSTRDTVRSARNALLTDLAALLDSVADGDDIDRDGLARGLDDRLRQLVNVARPLTRPIVFGNSPPRTRHRLVLYAAVVSHARALTVELRRHLDRPPGLAASCHALAAVARAVAAGQQPSHVDDLERLDPFARPLVHIGRALAELAPEAPRPVELPVPAEVGP